MNQRNAHLRTDKFFFVKTEKGDVIRKGQAVRNRLVIIFLGMVEIGFLSVIVLFMRQDPIKWLSLVVSLLFAAAIGGLMWYVIYLQRVPPMRFDSQLKVIRFNQGGTEKRIPFAEIRGIDMSFEPHPDSNLQNSGTYQIIAFLTGVRSLPIAQISGMKNVAQGQAQKLVIMIEEATGIRTKPAADMTAKMKTMQDIAPDSFNVGMVAQHLGRIQQEGGQANSVIFLADEKGNYYIQFAGQKGDQGLYAEAAGNPVIPKNYRLSQEKQSRLVDLGWETAAPESPNYHRQWQAGSYNERLAIAKIVMQTFADVYGADSEQSLEVNLNLK